MIKNKLNIGIFAYNFKHWKTQVGIQNLILSGLKPKVVLAADPVKLNIHRSNVRTNPRGLFLFHPKEVATAHNIDYHVVKHNSMETSKLVIDYQLDLGVILGARILKPIAFKNFTKGVLNMHPGLLPDNRGLDTIKWAILRGSPQGVTTHIIDANIDRGLLVDKQKIEIYKDDSLVDIQIRIHNLEQKMMLESIEEISKNGISKFCKLGEGRYNPPLTSQIEAALSHEFQDYKRKYCS